MDWDLYSDDELTARQKAAAMAAALRKQQEVAETTGAFGGLGLLTGDNVLGGFGEAQMANANRMLGRVGEQEQALRQVGQHRLERALRQKELEANRAFQAEQKELDRRIRAEELHQRGLDRDALFGAKRDERQSASDEKQLKELSEDVDKLGGAGFYEREKRAREIMESNPKDLPGFGPVAGHLPDAMISDEGVELRQTVGQLLSEYRKGQTGAGMSDAERTEYGRITGLLQSGNEKSVRMGVDQLRRAMDSRIGARAAGSPRAAEQYAARQPWFKEAVGRQSGAATAPAAAKRPVYDKTGKLVGYIHADGTEELVE